MTTREKILNTAEALFAEKGYEGVSVRDITGRAGCNVAAVNYHFGSKKSLYREVFLVKMAERSKKVQSLFWKKIGNNSDTPPEKIIRSLSEAFLKSPFSEKERIIHHKLMAREAERPSEVFDEFHKEVLMPFFRSLFVMLEPHMPGTLKREQKILYLMSIFAQIIHFNLARTMITKVTGQTYDEKYIDELIEHIVRFSLKGICGRQNGI
jgi:AcrR family transcriptional regulator